MHAAIALLQQKGRIGLANWQLPTWLALYDTGVPPSKGRHFLHAGCRWWIKANLFFQQWSQVMVKA